MKKKFLLVLISATVAIAGLFSFLSARTYINAQESFVDSGYILTSGKNSESVNDQRYFTSGTKYQTSYSGNVSFTDINKDKVVIDSKVFVHYDDESLFGLNDSVIMDTDHLDDEQISYYSISTDSVLVKAGNNYSTSNAGARIDFSNFVWKISEQRYMIVSSKIDLVVSDESQQTFEGYIELEYMDAGVAHLVNKQGTYSTISSGAYLELANGIRVYIGSKNVSNKDGILMNLTQMVVNSDDNIEVIPDEKYKKENQDQPQIIVNAKDGEAGKDGLSAYEAALESGEFAGTYEEWVESLSGQEGNPGGEGKKGNKGAEAHGGQQGASAKESGITYVEDVIPQFTLTKDLDITPFSVYAEFDYSTEYTTLAGGTDHIEVSTDDDAITYMIVDTANSNVVWKRSFSSEELRETQNPLTSVIGEAVSTLRQNKEYALTVEAEYRPVNYANVEEKNDFVTQQVFRQLFYTGGYGIDLKLDHTTTDAVYMNLEIEERAFDLINKFAIDFYDKDKTLFDVNDDYSFTVVSDNASIIDIEAGSNIVQMNRIHQDLIEDYPLTVQIKFSNSATNNLESNTTYFSKINVYSLVGGHDISTVPTNSFSYVEGKTHKLEPIVSAPTLNVADTLSSIQVTPGYVEDKDEGIQRYRYDFYCVDTQGGETTYSKVYSVTKPNLDAFNVNVYEDPDDPNNNTNLIKGKTYTVKTVAIFDNNEYIEEVDSIYATPVSISATYTWPTTTIFFNTYSLDKTILDGSDKDKYERIFIDKYQDRCAPSVIDGYITILDPSNVITGDAQFIVTYTRLNCAEEDKIVHSEKYNAASKKVNLPTEQTTYKIPFAYTGLLENTTYQVDIVATEVNCEGTITSNVPLGSKAVSTVEYMPVYFAGIDANKDATDAIHAIEAKVLFTLDPEKYLEQECIKITYPAETAEKIGLNDTTDLTMKSMTALYFDVFAATSEGKPDTSITGRLSGTTCAIYAPIDYSPVGTENIYKNWYLDIDKYNDFYLLGNRSTAYSGATLTDDFYNSGYAEFTYVDDDSTKPIANVTLPETIDGTPYTYSITITEDMFDDSLAQKIASYKKDHPDRNLFIKVENCDPNSRSQGVNGYDYTYARGITELQPVYDSRDGHVKYSNIIKIGNTNEYTGDIYDKYLPVTVKRTIPEWKDDITSYYKVTELTKKYFVDNNDLFEEKNNCLSNIYNAGAKETVDTIPAYWTGNLSLNTTTGYVLQGNSDWLFGYSEAVRYIVYDHDGHEVTRSYNDDTTPIKYFDPNANDGEGAVIETTYGEDGWIYCDRSRINEIPKWVFNMDVSEYTYMDDDTPVTKTIGRGDRFTVVMDVKLIEYPYYYTPDGGSTMELDYVYPMNYDSSKRIYNDFVSYKQMPQLLAIQYMGSKDDGIDDVYYTIIKDTDKALTYIEDDKNYLSLFAPIDGGDETIIKAEINEVVDADVPFLYTLTFDSSKQTYAHYDLKNFIDLDPVLGTYGDLEFVCEKDLTTGKSINFEDINIERFNTHLEDHDIEPFDIDKEWGKVLVVNDPGHYSAKVYLQLDTTEADFLSCIKGIDLEFENSNPEDITKDSKVVYNYSSDQFRTIITIDEGSNHSVIIESPQIDYSDLARICNIDSASIFKVKASIYNETNNYGAYYAEKQTTDDNNYFRYDAATIGGTKYDPTTGGYPATITKELLNRDNLSFEKKQGSTVVDDYDDLYQLLIGHRTITDDSFVGYKFDFNPYGAVLVPKEITIASENKVAINEFKIDSIIPECIITVDNVKKIGMHTATLNVQLTSLGTLIESSGLTARLTNPDSTTEDINLSFTKRYDDTNPDYTISFDEATLTWQITFNNLKSSSQYKLDAYGTFRTDIGTQQLNKETKEFSTLIELVINYDQSKLVNVTAKPTTRDDKWANAHIVFDDIYISDIQKGVNDLTINIYKKSDVTGDVEPATTKAVSTVKLTRDELIAILIEKNPTADTTKPFDYVLNQTLEWKPSADHILDSNDMYCAFVRVSYGDEKVIGNNNHVVAASDNFDNRLTVTNALRAAGVPGSNPDETYFINYTFSGTDTRRILTGHSIEDVDNSVTYVVELHKVDSDGRDSIVDVDVPNSRLVENKIEIKTITYPKYVKYDETLHAEIPEDKIYEDVSGNKYVSASDVTGFVGSTTEDHKVLFVDTTTYGSGGASQGQYLTAIRNLQFKVDVNSKYYLKMYSIADVKNEDLLGITSDSLNDKIFEPANDESIRFINQSGVYDVNNVPYYIYVSGTVNSPFGSSVVVYSLSLIPTMNRIDVTGTSLNRITKIEYQLIEKGIEGGEEFYREYDTVTVTSSDFGTIWRESDSGQLIYYLSVGNLKNSNSTYYVVVKLYSGASAETLEVTAEGSYSPVE